MTTGSDVVVAGAKLRALLAVLALHVGRVVPTEQLVDALWGEDPPAAVRNGLQGLASKLRRALGSADLVAMRGDGYALELPADADRRAPVRAARRRRAGRRPPPVISSGAVDAPGRGRRAVAGRSPRRLRLRGLRRRRRSPGCPSCASRAIEERLDLELQLGRHQRRDRPARGARRRPSAARAAPRAADARAVPRRPAGRRPPGLPGGPPAPGRGARASNPGHELRRLEAAILAQDRSLDAPAGRRPAPAARRRTRARPSPRR